MPSDAQQTTDDLYKSKLLTDDDLTAIVVGWVEDRVQGPIPLVAGYKLDVAKAVEAHKPAWDAMADAEAPEGLKRTMVRTAIVLAVPTKA